MSESSVSMTAAGSSTSAASAASVTAADASDGGEAQTMRARLERYVARDHALGRALEWARTQTGGEATRLQLFLAALVPIATYLLAGPGASGLCHFLCTFYPSRRSVAAMESEERGEAAALLLYWCLYSFACSLNPIFAQSLPGYWLIIATAMAWLWFPVTDGARIVYERVVRPFALLMHGKVEADAWAQLLPVVAKLLGGDSESIRQTSRLDDAAFERLLADLRRATDESPSTRLRAVHSSAGASASSDSAAQLEPTIALASNLVRAMSSTQLPAPLPPTPPPSPPL